jgi:hypothetical protein
MMVVGLLSSAGSQASAETLCAGNTGDAISAQLPLLSHDAVSPLANGGEDPALAIAVDDAVAVAKASDLYFDLLSLSDFELVGCSGPVGQSCNNWTAPRDAPHRCWTRIDCKGDKCRRSRVCS